MQASKTVLGLCLAMSIVAQAGTKNQDVADSVLVAEARKALAKVIKVPPGCNWKVVSPPGRIPGRKVIFDLAIPPGRWALSKHPEVWFPDREEKSQVRIWRFEQPAPLVPGPEEMAQWYLQRVEDPATCIKVMALWFDAHRNRGRIVNYAYDRYAWAYREAKRTDQWMAVLKQEAGRATAPEAQYEIHKHMARVFQARQTVRPAIEQWQLAQNVMRQHTNSYQATRFAIPYFEMGKLHVQLGNTNEAVECFQQFLSTEHGQGNAFDAIPLLGDIYEARGTFGNARKLYATVLRDDYGKNWASQVYLRQSQAPIRERMRLLSVQEKLDALVPQLASDPNAARKAILNLGRDGTRYLSRYKDHRHPQVREAIRRLIDEIEDGEIPSTIFDR